MSIIYEPKGKAREYSELACNLYTGCKHKCRYCYCPMIRRQTLNKWSNDPKPRRDILKNLEKDAGKLFRTEKELLFCFMSDPYQSDEAAYITRQALLICEKYQFKNVQVLTKAGHRTIQDFDIFKKNNWKFGSTICFRDENLREYWEENAPSIKSRYDAIKKANEAGVYTWISIEPVINPNEALLVIEDLYNYVDFWKIGKLNYFPEIENKTNWSRFIESVECRLKDKQYYIKRDLLKFKK